MNDSSKQENSNEVLSHSMVHYLLTIHKLKEKRGFARVTDIAKDLGLTKGSVSTALNNLKKKGLVEEEEDCKFLILSDTGHEEVHKILSSRTILFYFLKDFVGVSDEIAINDACNMEHLMSDETREKFFKFMKNLACSCEEMQSAGKASPFNFETTLDFCQFGNLHDFEEMQFGDTILKADEE